jgi:uncharacterized iron-regulated membrane protein
MIDKSQSYVTIQGEKPKYKGNLFAMKSHFWTGLLIWAAVAVILFGGSTASLYYSISQEVEYIEYLTLANEIKEDQEAKAEARAAMEDGYISKHEYNMIIKHHAERVRAENDRQAHEMFMESIK